MKSTPGPEAASPAADCVSGTARAGRRFTVAGAGLLGRLLAWRLLRLGHRVELVDREPTGGEGSAGRVAAAMLAPYSESVSAERAVFEAGLEALRIWPGWLAELAEDDPAHRPVAFQQRGSVVVAHRADAGNLIHFERTLRHKLPDHGHGIETLDNAALAELEPELAAAFEQGIWLAREGCLDNWGLFDALARAIPALGGRWHTGVEIARVAAGTVVAENGQRFEADIAIDTRGYGAKPQAGGLRGVRGEVLWVRAPEVSLSRPVRLMHPRYQLYIAPKPDSVYVIGATEIESESTAPITVRSGLELQSALYSIHTGFAEANVLRAFANLRPAFEDNLPRARLGEGRWQINGLFRHGYLLAPALVAAVLERGFEAADGAGPGEVSSVGRAWVSSESARVAQAS